MRISLFWLCFAVTNGLRASTVRVTRLVGALSSPHSAHHRARGGGPRGGDRAGAPLATRRAASAAADPPPSALAGAPNKRAVFRFVVPTSALYLVNFLMGVIDTIAVARCVVVAPRCCFGSLARSSSALREPMCAGRAMK